MKHKKTIFFILLFLYQAGIVYISWVLKFRPNHFSYLSMLVVYTATLLPAIFLFFSLVKEICADARLEAELHALKQQEQLQEKQHKVLQKRKADTQAFQQEVLENLTQLNTRLEGGNYQEALSYYQEISEDFQRIRFRPCCADSLLDAVLESKRETAAEHGITVAYQILLPDDLPPASAVLSCIFFNLMDNAVEACLRILQDAEELPDGQDHGKSSCEPPFIHLESKVNGDYLVIHMVNSKSADEIFSHGTVKKDPLSHGFGLSIIEETVQKHDGVCQWTDNGNSFDSLVSLRISKLTDTAFKN